MPTKNPRLSVTLNLETAAILDRLSVLTGNSKSAMVADLLQSSVPVFERMATVLEAAHTLKAEGMQAPESIKQGLDQAQSKLEKQLGLALETMDSGTRSLLQEAEKVGRRAVRGAPAGGGTRTARRAATPMSNRGVKNPKTGENRTKPGVNPKNPGGVK